jgi:hypothetical protein
MKIHCCALKSHVTEPCITITERDCNCGKSDELNKSCKTIRHESLVMAKHNEGLWHTLCEHCGYQVVRVLIVWTIKNQCCVHIDFNLASKDHMTYFSF